MGNGSSSSSSSSSAAGGDKKGRTTDSVLASGMKDMKLSEGGDKKDSGDMSRDAKDKKEKYDKYSFGLFGMGFDEDPDYCINKNPAIKKPGQVIKDNGIIKDVDRGALLRSLLMF